MSFNLTYQTIAYLLNLTDITYEIMKNGGDIIVKFKGSSEQLNDFCIAAIIDMFKNAFNAEKLSQYSIQFFSQHDYNQLKRTIETLFKSIVVCVPKSILKNHYELHRSVYKLEDFNIKG